MSRVSQTIFVAALVSVAGCASKPKDVAVAPLPPAPVVTVYAPPPVSPINRGLTQSATVWHMRAALNVAALACRGAQEAGIIQRYNAMLSAHKATLAAAEDSLSAEFKAGGGDWQDRYDDAMTRLYNFFSQAQARDAFCTAAAATLAETETLAPGELTTYAAAVLPTLDAPFAEMMLPRPVIAVASTGMGVVQAPTAMAQAPVVAPVAEPAVASASASAPRAVLPAVASREMAPARTPLPAVGTRAIAATPNVTSTVPRIEVDPSVLQD